MNSVLDRYKKQTQQVKFLTLEVNKFRAHCLSYHDHLTCKGHDHGHKDLPTLPVTTGTYDKQAG
jgi:hypothetical protein